MSVEQLRKAITASRDPSYFTQEINQRTLEVTINRPQQANGFTLGMYEQLRDILLDVQTDHRIDIVLLKANGRHFSSGNDMNNFTMANMDDRESQYVFAAELARLVGDMAITFLDFPKTMIACCQGGVIGFIFPLLILFDQVYVTDDAYFFAPMLLFSQSVEMFASYSFPRLFGHGKSFSLLVRCEKLSAQEAVHYGFAQKSFKTIDLMITYAREVCRQLESMDQSCIVIAKQFIKAPLREQMVQANNREIDNLQRIWKSESLMPNVMSYLGKLKNKPKL